MDTSTKVVPRERLDAIVALALAHVPAAQKATVEAFAREYFRQLDADDLADALAGGPVGRRAVALATWRDARRRASRGPRASTRR